MERPLKLHFAVGEKKKEVQKYRSVPAKSHIMKLPVADCVPSFFPIVKRYFCSTKASSFSRVLGGSGKKDGHFWAFFCSKCTTPLTWSAFSSIRPLYLIQRLKINSMYFCILLLILRLSHYFRWTLTRQLLPSVGSSTTVSIKRHWKMNDSPPVDWFPHSISPPRLIKIMARSSV